MTTAVTPLGAAALGAVGTTSTPAVWEVVETGAVAVGSGSGSGTTSLTLTGIDALPGDIIIATAGGRSTSVGGARTMQLPTSKPAGEGSNVWQTVGSLSGGGDSGRQALGVFLFDCTATWTNQSVTISWDVGGLVATGTYMVLRNASAPGTVRGGLPRTPVSGTTSFTLSGTAAPQMYGDMVIGVLVSAEASGQPTDDTDTTNGVWDIARQTSNLAGGTTTISHYHTIQVKQVTAASNQTFNPTLGAQSGSAAWLAFALDGGQTAVPADPTPAVWAPSTPLAIDAARWFDSTTPPTTDVVLGQVTSVEVPFPIAMSGTLAVPLGEVNETDTAQPLTVTATYTQAIGQVQETDTANQVAVLGGYLLGQTLETDTAQALSVTYGIVAATLGLSSETDTANPVTYQAQLAQAIGQSSETDTARPLTATYGSITQALGRSFETDVANPFTVVPGTLWFPLGKAEETDTALTVTPTRSLLEKQLGLSREFDTLRSLSVVLGTYTQALGRALSTETPRPFTSYQHLFKPIGQPQETDLARAFDAFIFGLIQPLGQVAETDEALTPTVVRIVKLGQALERDTLGFTMLGAQNRDAIAYLYLSIGFTEPTLDQDATLVSYLSTGIQALLAIGNEQAMTYMSVGVSDPVINYVRKGLPMWGLGPVSDNLLPYFDTVPFQVYVSTSILGGVPEKNRTFMAYESVGLAPLTAGRNAYWSTGESVYQTLTAGRDTYASTYMYDIGFPPLDNSYVFFSTYGYYVMQTLVASGSETYLVVINATVPT